MEKNKGDPPNLILTETEFQVVMMLRAMKPYDKLEISVNQTGKKISVKCTHAQLLDFSEKRV